jgi:hypothetical protein
MNPIPKLRSPLRTRADKRQTTVEITRAEVDCRVCTLGVMRIGQLLVMTLNGKDEYRLAEVSGFTDGLKSGRAYHSLALSH